METETVQETRKQPAESTVAHPSLRNFLATVAAAPQSVLLLDFDGTLAPFRVDPAAVKPWAGVVQTLDAIQQTGRTRIALISGRPAQDVASRLAIHPPPEVWGLHGAEHLRPDGRIGFQKLSLREQVLLKAARAALETNNLTVRRGLRIELKWNAVAVHWRGHSLDSAKAAEEAARTILKPFLDARELDTLYFDGGIELRAGRNKGDAVRLLLSELPNRAPAAYLGDDTTDEHAFEAIAGRGLSLLIRRQWRPTAANLWMRPPHGLRAFLRAWLSALGTSSNTQETRSQAASINPAP